MSTGGQWLSAWEQQNPGMVAPGVTADQAQQAVPGFDASKLGQPGQDPAWLIAALGKHGVGPGAAQAPGVPGVGDPVGQPMSAELLRVLSGLQGQGDAAAAQHAATSAELQRLYLDPSNPYSQRSLLDRAFTETKLRTTNQMAAQHQLFNGAYSEQQGIDQRNALTAENQMLEEYRGKRSANDQELAQALAALRGQGDTALYAEAQNRSALDQMSDIPATTGPMAAPAAKPKKKAKKKGKR